MEIQVSDHAVVRWLERHDGHDLTDLRAAIAARPASGGYARDKMVVRELDPELVGGVRADIRAAIVAAFAAAGIDEDDQLVATSVATADGWILPLSPHPGGRSVATVIEPGMEHGGGSPETAEKEIDQ